MYNIYPEIESSCHTAPGIKVVILKVVIESNFETN